MDILDDYKNGADYFELETAIRSLDNLDSKVENIKNITEAFLRFSPKEQWVKLETTLYILSKFSNLIDKTIFKNILLDAESLIKENDEAFISEDILKNYIRSLNNYFGKNIVVEDF